MSTELVGAAEPSECRMTPFDRHVLGQYYGYLLRRFGKPNYIRGVRRVAKFPMPHKMRLVHRRWQTLVEYGLIPSPAHSKMETAASYSKISNSCPEIPDNCVGGEG